MRAATRVGMIMVWLGVPGPLLACGVCLPEIPEHTVADRLVDSATVVLAREDREQRFRFAPMEVLRGDAGAAAPRLVVNTSVRRRLAANPGLGLRDAIVRAYAGMLEVHSTLAAAAAHAGLAWERTELRGPVAAALRAHPTGFQLREFAAIRRYLAPDRDSP